MKKLEADTWEHCLRLNAFLLVIDCSIFDTDDSLQFNVDLWSLGVGDLIRVNIYDWAMNNDLAEIVRLKNSYKAGNVLVAQECDFHVSNDVINLYGKKLEIIDDKEQAEAFTSKINEMISVREMEKSCRASIDKVSGEILDVKILKTKDDDLMAFVQLQAGSEIVDAVFFPEAYKYYEKILRVRDEIIIHGEIQEEFVGNDGSLVGRKIFAEQIEFPEKN